MGRTHWTGMAAALAAVALFSAGCNGPQGEPGPGGTPGEPGLPGATGPQGSAGPTGSTGSTGPTGPAGTNGTNGTNGTAGVACWDLNGNGTCEAASEDKSSDGLCTALDCLGQPGYGYLALEANGVVGFVRDTAGAPVAAAKVYLVPQGQIPDAGLELSTNIALVRADPNDEPLEDPIAANGASFAQATTNVDGIYRIATIPSGSFFVVVEPDALDVGHLPGGSLCRKATARADLAGKQVNLTISTRPSAGAVYVGPSVCLNCHGKVHTLATAHMNGLRKPGTLGPLQDATEFPGWNLGLAKFGAGTATSGGTTLYFYGYGGTPGSPNYKVSETDPGAAVSFTARLYSTAGAAPYLVELRDVKGATAPATYEVDLTYGGGVYKQRYIAKLADGSRYVLPIQFNQEGAGNGLEDAGTPASRWTWQHYNAQYWYDETVPGLRVPAKGKSFDNNCAGCHFTGFKLAGDATAGYRARAVPDPMGELDFDGDGKLEALNISCETCHGPGSEHWERAGNGRSIVTPSLLTPEREVAICSACHTRALGIGGGNTEAPLDSSGSMPRAGLSRKEFLTNHISKIDDGLWSATTGDGKHSVKHHQQASDFIKTRKYRNPSQLLTCSACHDLHGTAGDPKQLRAPLESSDGTPGLCLSCHGATFPTGLTQAARFQAHYAAQGLTNINMPGAQCAQCHMPKTAKSGAGRAQATIAGVKYYSGDISSHLFQVPRRTSIPSAGKGPEMLSIPYTLACGQGCHSAAP